jgi:hypothetical protein
MRLKSFRKKLHACVLVLLASFGAAHAVEGLYVWGEAAAMVDAAAAEGATDEERQTRFLEFCRAYGVRRVHFLADPRTWDERSLTLLLNRARQLSLEVFALAPGGLQSDWIASFRWTGRCKHRVVLDWIEAVVRFNAAHPDGAFAGVQLDIEPHRAGRSLILRRDKPMWDAEAGGLLASERNRRIAEQYLDLLDAVGARIRGLDPPVRFAATIPTWFDRDTPRESYVLEHGGARQTLASLIQRRVDFVTLMDYLDGSGSDGADAAWSEIEQELDAGPVEALFETAPPRKGRKHPKPAETLFEEGETALFKMCEALRDRFADEPNYLGCAAHYYLHAVGSGLRGWPRYP